MMAEKTKLGQCGFKQGPERSRPLGLGCILRLVLSVVSLKAVVQDVIL
jgi:hypothetical protein